MSPKIIDGFIFYNELELLNYRLNVLNDVVDYFIIVESTHTFVGKEKTLYYQENKELFNERFITFRFLELKPELFTKKKEFDERFYEKLDELENEILDGKKFDEIISNNKQSVRTFEMVNSRRTKRRGKRRRIR